MSRKGSIGRSHQLSTGTTVDLRLSIEEPTELMKKLVDVLHGDNDLMIAASLGDDRTLAELIRDDADVHVVDELGRTALHLAVCADSMESVEMLLKAGVNPNLKDQVGMTPLSLCLMRRPSLKVVELLAQYGAVILPRESPTDTGLFLQFVMMCEPTEEEEAILRLMVEKLGSKIDDPGAPGGRQALHIAAMANNCKLAEILIDLGADLHSQNHRYRTPKEIALDFKCFEVYDLLSEVEAIEAELLNTQSADNVGTNRHFMIFKHS